MSYCNVEDELSDCYPFSAQPERTEEHEDGKNGRPTTGGRCAATPTPSATRGRLGFHKLRIATHVPKMLALRAPFAAATCAVPSLIPSARAGRWLELVLCIVLDILGDASYYYPSGELVDLGFGLAYGFIIEVSASKRMYAACIRICFECGRARRRHLSFSRWCVSCLMA